MNESIDEEFQLAKRKVCNAVSNVYNFARNLDAYAVYRGRRAIDLRKVVESFEDWLRYFESDKTHPVQIPASHIAYDPIIRWPLASTLCYAEMYLKAADLIEKKTAEPTEKAKFEIQEARSTVTEFLRKYGKQITAEANSSIYSQDRKVIDAAVELENLPEKFRLLAKVINRDNTLDNSQAPEETSLFHDRLIQLGIRPIGLYCSLGKETFGHVVLAFDRGLTRQ